MIRITPENLTVWSIAITIVNAIIIASALMILRRSNQNREAIEAAVKKMMTLWRVPADETARRKIQN